MPDEDSTLSNPHRPTWSKGRLLTTVSIYLVLSVLVAVGVHYWLGWEWLIALPSGWIGIAGLCGIGLLFYATFTSDTDLPYFKGFDLVMPLDNGDDTIANDLFSDNDG